MFDIGFWEILLIGVVSLMVIGPDKLPEVARTVGRWVGKTQRFVAGVKSDLHSELQTGELRKMLGDQEQQIQELKEIVKETKRGLEQSGNEVTSSLAKNLDEAKTSLESIDKQSPSSPVPEENQ